MTYNAKFFLNDMDNGYTTNFRIQKQFLKMLCSLPLKILKGHFFGTLCIQLIQFIIYPTYTLSDATLTKPCEPGFKHIFFSCQILLRYIQI